MIDIKELRIGNIVKADYAHYNQFHGYGEVTQIYKDGFTVDYHYPGKWFEAVPLTPELLEKAGFAKDGFNAYNICISPWPDTHLKQLSFSGDYLYLREGELKDGREKDSICVLWNNDLRGKMPLHQIQNLYWWLTNTELTLTP